MIKKTQIGSSFDSFAEKYDKTMGDMGDYTHQKTIDPALFEAVGNFKGKVIYDVACGNGYISRKLANGGAKEVWASDISSQLIEIAQSRYEKSDNLIKFLVCDSSDFSIIPNNYFDIVVMNMALHYVADFQMFVFGLKKVLKNKGRFVFTHIHPLSKMAVKQARTATSEKDFKDLFDDNKDYLVTKKKIVYNVWTGEENILYYHAPIGYYINMLAKHGFLVDKFIEKEAYLNINYGEKPGKKYSSIPFVYALGAIKMKIQ